MTSKDGKDGSAFPSRLPRSLYTKEVKKVKKAEKAKKAKQRPCRHCAIVHGCMAGG